MGVIYERGEAGDMRSEQRERYIRLFESLPSSSWSFSGMILRSVPGMLSGWSCSFWGRVVYATIEIIDFVLRRRVGDKKEEELDNQGRRTGITMRRSYATRRSSVLTGALFIERVRTCAIGDGLGELWLELGGAASLPHSSWHVAIGGAC